MFLSSVYQKWTKQEFFSKKREAKRLRREYTLFLQCLISEEKIKLCFKVSPKNTCLRSPASRNVLEKVPRRAEKAHRKRIFLKKVAPTSLFQKSTMLLLWKLFFRNEATRTQHYGTQR